MKKLIAFITLLTIVCSISYGQTSTDSITIKKIFGGYQFFQGEKRLNLNQLVKMMEPNEKAYQQIKSAQTDNTLANIFGIAGGFMVGWPLGSALGGGEPNWTMAGVGAGLIVISIPITKSFNKKAKQAVQTYNAKWQSTSFCDENELKLSFNRNGVGLMLNF